MPNKTPYKIEDHVINPNGSIFVGMPRERVLIPKFVDNRDAMLANLRDSGRGTGYYQHEGHRVDRNRDHICNHFLKNTKAEWLLMIDTDMEHPLDLGQRLSAWGKPIVGGLYFHRGQSHDPFVFKQGEVALGSDIFGRKKQQWYPLRDEVYDFLIENKVPNKDGATVIGKPGELGLMECDAVATGAILIHRSVLEHMEAPWFEYRPGGNSEDLVFCMEAKDDYGIPVHCDLSTISGHYNWQPMGQTQFKQMYEGRGINLSLYQGNEIAHILGDFLEITPEKAFEEISGGNAHMVGTYWRSKKPKTAKEVREFYDDPHTGYLYLLELIHWNVSPVFDYFKKQLLPFRNLRILELGSGIGSMAIQLALQNNTVISSETNDYLRRFCEHRWIDLQDKLNGKVGELTFVGHEWKTMPENEADVIIAFDVIEHLAKSDAKEFVMLAGNILKQGGKLMYHNNWGQQDLYPMHFDYSEDWPKWLKAAGLVETSPISAVKTVNPISKKEIEDA